MANILVLCVWCNSTLLHLVLPGSLVSIRGWQLDGRLSLGDLLICCMITEASRRGANACAGIPLQSCLFLGERHCSLKRTWCFCLLRSLRKWLQTLDVESKMLWSFFKMEVLTKKKNKETKWLSCYTYVQPCSSGWRSWDLNSQNLWEQPRTFWFPTCKLIISNYFPEHDDFATSPWVIQMAASKTWNRHIKRSMRETLGHGLTGICTQTAI